MSQESRDREFRVSNFGGHGCESVSQNVDRHSLKTCSATDPIEDLWQPDEMTVSTFGMKDPRRIFDDRPGGKKFERCTADRS